MNNPKECRYGIDCYYRHIGDVDRSEYMKSIHKPKVEMKKEVSPSQPRREPKHWNAVKKVETPLSLFGGEDAFPALGPATPAQRVELTEEVVEEESKEMSDQEEQKLLEPQSSGEPRESSETREFSELEEQDVSELQESSEPQDFSESKSLQPESHSHVNVGSSSLITQEENDNDGEWISGDTLSR